MIQISRFARNDISAFVLLKLVMFNTVEVNPVHPRFLKILIYIEKSYKSV